MPGGKSVSLGPFSGGLHNSSGTGEFIDDKELFALQNLEVDLDGSLANRPAINTLATPTGLTDATGLRVIGSYLPADGRNILVLANTTGSVMLVDTASNTQIAVQTVTAIACVQYKDNLYICGTPVSGTTGGFFSIATAFAAPTWTAVAGMPQGEAMVLYKERLFIAAGIGSTGVVTSRIWWSSIAAGNTWDLVAGFADVEPGNGQKIVTMTVLNQDIIIFKQHSTYRFGYSSSIAKFDLSKVSATIGAPGPNCAVTYDSNNVYVLHDNNVYELFNYNYTKIGKQIKLAQIINGSFYATDNYGLSLYRDRLFVRYYSNLYVYSLVTKTWSQWVTTKFFSRLVTIPSSDIGLDTAYATSSNAPGTLYYFRDDRVTGIGTAESFTCTVITKTYDLDIPHLYKVLFWWGLQIATSGTITATVTVPNAGANYTWDFWKATYTWATILASTVKWSNNDIVMTQNVITPTLGKYARKFLKLGKKMRFRQINFTVSADAQTNTVGDASVRIFDITILTGSKETVVKQTS